VKRRRAHVFGLAFLDAMTCGLGAVVLLFIILNGQARGRARTATLDLRAEVDRIEERIVDETESLVVVRNSLREVEDETVLTRGLSRRLLERLRVVQEELSSHEADTLARQESLEQLKSDLRTLEQESRRLSASMPSPEEPGRRVRTFVGDGDRQYLTGLKVGGERILILVDASASMLDETLVNVIRRRNLPDDLKRRADKWQQAMRTVDWLTTQLPRQSRVQVYRFAETAEPLVPESRGRWLEASDRSALDGLVTALRQAVPGGGTSLWQAFSAASELSPPPDNILLVTDGLPTMAESRPGGATVTGRQRLKFFEKAVKQRLPSGTPLNVILLPMEGDPMAMSAFWSLAIRTGGSCLTPSRDWP
jgi:hypothetical protein